MNLSTVDPATVQAMAWIFGSLLFFLFSTVTLFLIKLLSELAKSRIQHELRITSLEDDMGEVQEIVFPAKQRKR